MVPTSPLARSADPHTSAEAADSVVADGTVARHERLILEALERLGPSGGTATEISAEISCDHRAEHLDSVQVTRRLSDLVFKRGKLRRHVKARRNDGKPIYSTRGGRIIHWLADPPDDFGPLFERQTARKTR